MIRVLVLSKYGLRAASPRYRFAQYAPRLEAEGISLAFSPLLDDDYLAQRLTTEKAPVGAAAKGLVRRLGELASASSWDVLWIHCELLPYFPPWLELALDALGIPYVYDFDDAIFHGYDQHPNALVRGALGGKVATIIRKAAAVTAGSPYLESYARRFNDHVHAVPTVVDVRKYPVKRVEARPELVVGWIGSPSTSRYLEILRAPLAALAARVPVRLVAIGSRPLEIPGMAVEVRPWGEDTEVSDLLEADVGVMPLVDEPWARGKCAFKLIQYMAAGLAVVASPVGMNTEVVDASCGHLASSPEEWTTALETLFRDPQRRAAQGAAGRRRVEARYALDVTAPRVAGILTEAARRPRRGRTSG